MDDCIKEGILADFLSKNRAEAIAMSIFEYDEEKHMKSEREWAYKTGQEDGERRLARLLQALMDTGQNAKISRALSDASYREQLYREHNL